jgi:hypothetical protein
MTVTLERCLTLLDAWLEQAEQDWISLPKGMGCYGTGYNAWGVQTNQKYLCAAAAAGVLGARTGLIAPERAERWTERARAALRFSCASHHSGDTLLLDGTQWGHTWISQLGVERMMAGVQVLEPLLDKDDRAALDRMLQSEADYCAIRYQRGRFPGISGDVWNASGKNNPESNGWVGALLWRCSQRYPEDPRAADWAEQGIGFLLNTVSIASDASSDTVIDGKALRERHHGANFFPNYALDHHGYLNVGYMVICLSGAAFLHFDLQHGGHARPEALDHHQHDLWQVVKGMVFADGRLIRIGGDSRLRYSYCQEYLLPTCAYMADRFDDRSAATMADGQLGLIEREAAASADGSFYGARFETLRRRSVYYLTRLESDRANVIAQLACYLAHKPALFAEPASPPCTASWCEPEHGAVMVRSEHRFASFSWRAYGLAQGLCLPPQRSDLAEWQRNLAGGLHCQGDEGFSGGWDSHRKPLGHRIHQFDGGFATCGALREGCSALIPEGWRAPEDGQAEHHIAWVALPDGHTCVGLQRCTALLPRIYLRRAAGLDLAIPNDVFNASHRTLCDASGSRTLTAGSEDADHQLGPWACVDEQLACGSIYGGDLALERRSERQGGPHPSLHCERLSLQLQRDCAASGTVLDCGWFVASAISSDHSAALHQSASALELGDDLRAVSVTGQDGKRYTVIANFGATAATTPTAYGSCLAGSTEPGDVCVLVD